MSLDLTLYENWCQHFHQGREVASFNITHNLCGMADAAGIYEILWRPEENACEYARDITQILREGIAKLLADPERFKKLNSPNGWGTYENFVRFAQGVLDACERYPDAKIKACR